MMSVGEENPNLFKIVWMGNIMESEGKGYSSSQHGGHLGERPA